jgi:hypothetical protein
MSTAENKSETKVEITPPLNRQFSIRFPKRIENPTHSPRLRKGFVSRKKIFPLTMDCEVLSVMRGFRLTKLRPYPRITPINTVRLPLSGDKIL